MPFNGSEGESISLQEAKNLTSNYQKNNPKGTIATFIGKDIIHSILDQEECMGIRIYYGEENDGEQRLVLVGAKANKDDMTDGVLADRGSHCPPACDYTSPLK